MSDARIATRVTRPRTQKEDDGEVRNVVVMDVGRHRFNVLHPIPRHHWPAFCLERSRVSIFAIRTVTTTTTTQEDEDDDPDNEVCMACRRWTAVVLPFSGRKYCRSCGLLEPMAPPTSL